MENNNHKLLAVAELARDLGVTDQTIRNYAKKGILSYVRIGARAYISRESIENMRNDLRITAEGKRKLKELKDKYEEEIAKYDQALYHLEQDNSLLYFLARVSYSRTLMKAVVSSLGKDYLTEEEKNIIFELLDCKRLSDIAIRHGRSKNGIENIVKKTIRNLGELVTYSDLEKEIGERNSEIETLKATIRSLQDEIDNYRMPKNRPMAFSNDDRRLIKLLETRIDEIDFSVKTSNCMKSAEIETLGDLVQYNRLDLLKFRGLGRKTLTEIEEYLQSKGLTFGMDVPSLMSRYAYYISHDGKDESNRVAE